MVIGGGLIANKFMEYNQSDSVLIFASGVSNSRETNPAEYESEILLLTESIRDNPDKLFIYFSTTSIYDEELNSSHYVQHKIKVENIIKELSKSYIIFRVSQVIGISSNPFTVFNFFYNCINDGLEFDLWSEATRNFIDIDDLYSIASSIIESNQYLNNTLNIGSIENIPIIELVKFIENYLSKKANYKVKKRGSSVTFDTSTVKKFADQLNINLVNKYNERVINKYLLIRDILTVYGGHDVANTIKYFYIAITSEDKPEG